MTTQTRELVAFADDAAREAPTARARLIPAPIADEAPSLGSRSNAAP